MLIPCISAIKILGFKAPIPLYLDSLLNFWEILSSSSVITFITSTTKFHDPIFVGHWGKKEKGEWVRTGPGTVTNRNWLSMPIPVSKGLEMALTYSAWQQLSSNPSVSRNLSYGNNQDVPQRRTFNMFFSMLFYYRGKKKLNAQQEGKSYVGMGIHTYKRIYMQA